MKIEIELDAHGTVLVNGIVAGTIIIGDSTTEVYPLGGKRQLIHNDHGTVSAIFYLIERRRVADFKAFDTTL